MGDETYSSDSVFFNEFVAKPDQRFVGTLFVSYEEGIECHKVVICTCIIGGSFPLDLWQESTLYDSW